MAAWLGDRETVRMMGSREVKDETVYSFVFTDEDGTPTMREGLPSVGMAIARKYNVRGHISNLTGYNHPVVEIVRGRLRTNSPVEIMEIYRDGVRLA